MFGPFIVAAIIIYLTINWLRQRPINYPPGPPCFPVIGNIPFVPSGLLHITMAECWRKKYGPLVGLVLGPYRAIAVCGSQEVLEVLKRDEFQGRPRTPFLKDRSFNKYLGIIFSDGHIWAEQQRFTLKTLREFGFDKNTMEGVIMDEVEDTIKEMSEKRVFQVNGIFSVSTLNLIWGMLTGTKFSRGDPEIEKSIKKMKHLIQATGPAGVITDMFPFLKHIVPGLIGHTETIDIVHEMQEKIRNNIREHEQTLDENNPRDLMDMYLKEMKNQKLNPCTTFTEEGLITLCCDLYGAAEDTTASALEISFLYMVLYPKVQETIQTELDVVVGQNRRPTLEDRARLPYVEAVIAELFRIASPGPLAITHRATEDAYMSGYFIPKDTFLIAGIHCIHTDKQHWGDPDVFRPERFLNAEGKFVKDEWLIPFGVGKRTCIGEILARNTLFLFFTSILQEFTFSIPQGHSKPSTKVLPGLVVSPRPFCAKVTKRFS